MQIRNELNSCSREDFGMSDGVSDMKNIMAKMVCFNDENIAEMRLKLIITDVNNRNTQS
jgi:hypothetical protein